MISYNKDGSIKLPEHLKKIQEGSRSAIVRYESLIAKAKDKRIKVLFLVEKPGITQNIYSDSNKGMENPLIKIFDAFDIKTDDINTALEELLNRGYFILYMEKDQYKNQIDVKSLLIELDPEKIVAIGSQFDKRLGFIRDDIRFVDEKLELGDNVAEKIKLLTENKVVEEGKKEKKRLSEKVRKV